ncbi:phosphoglycerate kinase [bacterium Unc6]|nr:phosphoglycerate kinase [bacterium Unc6]
MAKKTVRDIELQGKRILMRVDFNVPLDKSLNITDDTRIRAALNTIRYCIKQGAKTILISHLGRPDGKVVESMRLGPVAKRLEELLGKKVLYVKDCIGDEIRSISLNMSSGDVVLLENVRFYPEEEANDLEFSKKIALLGDIFVNDAFGTAHRAHSSTEGVAHFLSSVAGFLMEKEIKYIGDSLANPRRPFVAVLGGAKVSDKINVIKNILNIVDTCLIGGAMAYTFLRAQGCEVGDSRVEGKITDKKGKEIDILKIAGETLEMAKQKNKEILLPVDHIIADKFDPFANKKTVDTPELCKGWMALDIGPRAREIYSKQIIGAKMVMWNGPMGVFEMKGFEQGTLSIAKACAECTKKGGITIVGGGDSVAAVQQMGFTDSITHISTGGGASLEYMEGKVLPGIAALQEK